MDLDAFNEECAETIIEHIVNVLLKNLDIKRAIEKEDK